MATSGAHSSARRGRPTLLLPFQEFFRKESSSGKLLMFSTVVAMVWANSPWAPSYHHLWHTEVTIGGGFFQLSQSLHHWINDGLMAVFFFLVGLEIKRELLVGELSSLRQAALPISAAVGGMVVPALIYTAINSGGEGLHGWGVPMATDIAFALGILSLLGNRAPLALKIFLAALAIADDLGAVLVIALFYTDEISFTFLGAGMVIWAAMFGLNLILRIRHPLPYWLLGGLLWLLFLKSGVHATVAGVLGAFAIPARTRINSREFAKRARGYLLEFEEAGEPGVSTLTNERQRAALMSLERICEKAETPLQRLEHKHHPWVSYIIMPLFALANAGVSLQGGFDALAHPVSLGVIAGLVIGKQLGIFGSAWLMVKFGWASLPTGVGWRHIYGAALLGGVGFTMSLFVANLAFGSGELLLITKLGILTASVIAGVAGWLVLRGAPATAEPEEIFSD